MKSIEKETSQRVKVANVSKIIVPISIWQTMKMGCYGKSRLKLKQPCPPKLRPVAVVAFLLPIYMLRFDRNGLPGTTYHSVRF